MKPMAFTRATSAGVGPQLACSRKRTVSASVAVQYMSPGPAADPRGRRDGRRSYDCAWIVGWSTTGCPIATRTRLLDMPCRLSRSRTSPTSPRSSASLTTTMVMPGKFGTWPDIFNAQRVYLSRGVLNVG